MVFYIYKIKDVNYIGSTNDIKTRTQNHKTRCWNKNSKRYNYLIYQYIREKNKNIELEILFCYKKKCSFKIQTLVEQFYINKYDSINNGLNTRNAFGVDIKREKQYNKEWRKKNKEKKKEYDKEYYEKNKKKINQKQRTKINCPLCNGLITKRGLKRHQKSKKCLKAKNNKISQNEIDFKYNQTAYNEEGEFMNWY